MTLRIGLGLGVLPASSRPVPTTEPVNSGLPSISGIQTQGQTLSANPGSWDGMPSGTYAYQWTRAGSNIGGATSSTYLLTGTDVGQLIRVVVIATNSVGPSSPATSAAVTPAATLTISGTPGTASVGSAYTFTPTSAGGHTPKTYALTGTLPSGLSFNTSTGAITGTPLSTGTASGLNITVTDADLLPAALGTFSLVVASAGPVTGDASALTVRDATALNSVDGNGWTADVTFKGMAVGGTAIATSLAIPLTRAGFDSSGAAVTYAETVVGTLPLRKPAPNETTYAQATSGSDAVITMALTKRIYSTDTLGLPTIGAGAYTNGAASNASTIATTTNSSTRTSPFPLYAFLNVPHQAFGGSSIRAEMGVQHIEARFGRQVACVEFRVRDVATSTDQGISVKVNDPSLSQIVTQGLIPEVYGGSISMTGLTQGLEYEIYAYIYPWIGSAAFSTLVIGDAPATTGHANQAAIRFVCDKNGTWSNQFAYVKVGVSGGAVGSSATPYPTIVAAANALRTANNAKTGNDKHNNCAGSTIYLMETTPGGGASHSGFGGDMNAATATMKTWYHIAADPAASGVVKLVTGADKFAGDKMHMILGSTFTIDKATVLGNSNDDGIFDYFNVADLMVWVDRAQITLGYSPAISWLYRLVNGQVYETNCTMGAGGQPYNANMALVLGTIWNAAVGSVLRPQVVMGCIANADIEVSDSAGVVSDDCDRCFMQNNAFYKNVAGFRMGAAYTGMAHSQTIWEVLGSNSTILSADSAGPGNCVNLVEWHNLNIGDRANRLYTSSGISTPNTIKEGVSGYCIEYKRNTKSDYFYVASESGVSGTTRTGNWAYRYGVNLRGVVVMTGDNSSSTTYNPISWLGEVQPPASRPTATITFTNDASKAGTNVGGGNYHLTGSSNDAYGVVASDLGVFKYDIAGTLRLQNGSGAAGPYERP